MTVRNDTAVPGCNRGTTRSVDREVTHKIATVLDVEGTVKTGQEEGAIHESDLVGNWEVEDTAIIGA
jgi:hypothetical protein